VGPTDLGIECCCSDGCSRRDVLSRCADGSPPRRKTERSTWVSEGGAQCCVQSLLFRHTSRSVLSRWIDIQCTVSHGVVYDWRCTSVRPGSSREQSRAGSSHGGECVEWGGVMRPTGGQRWMAAGRGGGLREEGGEGLAHL
jgi:hypothetical protein